jgi:hypothetical protein
VQGTEADGVADAMIEAHTPSKLCNEQVKEGTMDFIERIFGLAPDGGSGSLEFLLFLIPLVGIALLIKYRRASRQQKRSNQ